MNDPIIILGTGLAGYQVAREFRKLDQTKPLLLITADEGKFYPKPQLSTAKTLGKTASSLVTADASAMSTQLQAKILTNARVTAIDTLNKTISYDNLKLTYEKLVLACGADVIKAPVIGNAKDEILSINHLYDYSIFENLLKDKKQITILGAGLIGCEFANDLSNTHFAVHVIALDKTPLERFLPKEIGKVLQNALEQNGVTFHLATTLKKIEKTQTGYQLELANGETINSELVLSAIGLKPHVDLAKTANLAIERGILVNRFLETSVKDIYAIGDCAEVEGHVLPFITPILNCARALAKTLAGTRTSVDYPAMPITVKTPAHPIVICPPLSHIQGNWEINFNDNSVRALFFDKQHQLHGFVLTNDAVKERISLLKQIPNWL